MTRIQITSSMIRFEKLINFYNRKYNFDTETLGTEKEKKDYSMSIKLWDALKRKRDSINAKVKAKI